MELPAHKMEIKVVKGYVAGVYALKASCLNCIIKNFDRLMLQYESGEVPKKPFQQLQITQSSTLFKEFLKERKYEKYMQFILNPSMKTIDIINSEWYRDDILTHLQTIAKNIINLSLRGIRSKRRLLLLLHKMKNLKTLTLKYTDLSYMLFRTIGRFCSSLESLDVHQCSGVTDENIVALCPVDESADRSLNTRCKNTTLKYIDINNESITYVGVAFLLEHFPNLEFIGHVNIFTSLYKTYGGSFKTREFNSLKKQYNLKKLIIIKDSEKLQESDLRMCRILCPHVSELMVGYLSSQPQLKVLSEFTGLTKVCVISELEPYLDVTTLIEVRGENLSVLILKYCTISTPALLNCCRNLKALKLKQTQFRSVEELKNMPPRHYFQHLEAFCIQDTSFSFTSVSNSVRSILSSAPNLQTLTFHDTVNVTNDFINSLSQCECTEKLKFLNVVGSNLGRGPAINLLLNFPNVVRYTLCGMDRQLLNFEGICVSRPFLDIIIHEKKEIGGVGNMYGVEDLWIDQCDRLLSSFAKSTNGIFFSDDEDDMNDDMNAFTTDESDDDNLEFDSESAEDSHQAEEGSSDMNRKNLFTDDENAQSKMHENSRVKEGQAVANRKRRYSSTDEEA